MSKIAIISGFLAAIFWLWSACVRIPKHVDTMSEGPAPFAITDDKKGRKMQIGGETLLGTLRKQSRLSAIAAFLTAISVLAQALSWR
jgi:hypothetical protein